MIAIITLDGTYLDLPENLELPFEENSKFFDANIFTFDYSNSFDLPFTNRNNIFFQSIGGNKTKVDVISDGNWVGTFYIKVLELKRNVNTGIGSYNVQLESVFSKFNEELTNTKIKDVFEYDETISFPNMNTISFEDTTIWDWLANEQNTPRNVPYRFPQYSLVKDIEGEISMAETLNKNYGNIVEVNWFDAKSLHPSYIKNIQFFVWKGVVMQGYFPEGNKIINWLDFPIRTWSIAVPCFFYTYVLEKCLNKMGYDVSFNFKSLAVEAKIRNLVLNNNYNILNYRVLAERQIKEQRGHVDQIVSTVYSKLSIWDWIPELVIKGKNHVPDITVSDLLFDFIIKSGGGFEIDGNKIKFTFLESKENDIPKKYGANATEKYEEILGNHIFKYEYEEDKNDDNIKDFVINNGTKNDTNNEIVSKIVPVLHRRKNVNTVAQGIFDTVSSYIIGAPNIDKTKTESIQKKVRYEYRYNNDDSVEAWELSRVFEEEYYEAPFVNDNKCPLFCSFVWKRTDLKNVNVLLKSGSDYVEYKSLQSFEWEDIISLQWTTADKIGLVDTMYTDKLVLFQTSKYHEVGVLFNFQEFKNFSHYDWVNFLGRKCYPLKRKYTLPFSTNPQIEYNLYEPK
jgi:hypothetical protein